MQAMAALSEQLAKARTWRSPSGPSQEEAEEEAASSARWRSRSVAQAMEHFEVRRLLGRGASGEALLAEHASEGPCVLKFVHLAGEPEKELRELRLLRRLRHPNVLRLQGAFVDQGRLVLRSEFCDAGDLEALVLRRRAQRGERTGNRCLLGFLEAWDSSLQR